MVMNIKYYILQKKTPTPTEGTTGSKRCFRCGETGHYIAKCPLPGPARGTPGERGGRGRGGGRGAGRGGFYIERPKAETSRKVKEIFQREERYRKWRQAEELSMKMTREESEIMGVSGSYTNTHKKKGRNRKYNKLLLLQWNKRAEDRKSKKAERRKRAEEARKAVSSDSEDDIKVR